MNYVQIHWPADREQKESEWFDLRLYEIGGKSCCLI